MFVYWLAYSQDIPGEVHLQYNAACFWRGEQDEGKGGDSSLYFYILNHDVNYSQNVFSILKLKPQLRKCSLTAVFLQSLGARLLPPYPRWPQH